MFEQQSRHIAYIVSQALARGVSTVEPTEEAVEAWCATVRETAIDNTNFQRECTPGYYNNEGEDLIRSHLGDPYWPGFYAMEDLLQAWRDSGELKGLTLG
jgi:cyclohexanone monooxygenase